LSDSTHRQSRHRFSKTKNTNLKKNEENKEYLETWFFLKVYAEIGLGSV